MSALLLKCLWLLRHGFRNARRPRAEVRERLRDPAPQGGQAAEDAFPERREDAEGRFPEVPEQPDPRIQRAGKIPGEDRGGEPAEEPEAVHDPLQGNPDRRAHAREQAGHHVRRAAERRGKQIRRAGNNRAGEAHCGGDGRADSPGNGGPRPCYEVYCVIEGRRTPCTYPHLTQTQYPNEYLFRSNSSTLTNVVS